MKYYFVLCFTLTVFALFNTTLSTAQKKEQIKILNANSLEGNSKLGEGVRRFLGDVVFEHNKATMYCDSAHMFSKENLIHAFSNVHISRGDTMHMYGDYMLYNGNTGLGRVRRNVRLEDEETTLFTDSLDFNTNTNIAHYFEGGKIINSDSSTLTSIEGYYFADDDLFLYEDSVVMLTEEYTIYTDTLRYHTENKIAYFIGETNIYSDDNHIYAENGWYKTSEKQYSFDKNVRYQNKEKILTCDSVFYDELKGVAFAFRNIEMKDTIENLILKGNYAHYTEEPETFLITDSTLLIQVSGIADSLFLHADSITSNYDSTSTYRILKAFHKVQMFRKDFQSRCDSMVYHSQDSVISMFKEPVIWSEGSQMTSKKIEIYIKNDKLDYFRLINSAFIVSQEDTSKYNQIRGKEMFGYIKENELQKVDVFGNGQTIYFTKDKNEIVGVNSAESSDLVIFLKNSEVRRIKMLKQPSGILYPPEELKETKLKGFIWLEELRPKTKNDIFYWN